MSELNLPYILELAGIAARSDNPSDTIALAVRNGIPQDQFERAITVMRGFDDGPEFVRRLYMVDGWVRGYTALHDEPSAWILGQQAHAYYDLERDQ